jgi:hypothetical protein
VDLMLIGQVGLADVSSPIHKAERRLNRAVNPTTYTRDDFAGKVKPNNEFGSTFGQ